MTTDASASELAQSNLQKLFASGLSLDAFVEQCVSERRRALLHRAALLRTFDRELVENVLLPGLPEIEPGEADDGDDAGWLLDHADVEAASTDPPARRMRELARATHLERWFGKSGEMTSTASRASIDEARRLSRAAALHLRPRGPSWELEHLYHLLVTDAGASEKTLRRLYWRADRLNDLARCFLVLSMAEERRPQIEACHRYLRRSATAAFSRLLTSIDDLRCRYDTRRAFLQDLEKTSHVLERELMKEEWRRLSARGKSGGRGPRAASAQWIVHLEGKGGSGKTMYLRWLASQKCLRAGLPYARLDFDFARSELTRTAPWQLLALFAEKLDPQLPGRPFQELIKRAEELAGIAGLRGDRYGNVENTSTPSDQSVAAVGSEIVSDFIEGLRVAARRRPGRTSVVLVLDTLEVVLLDERASLLDFLQVLDRVHAAVPSIRLILSGRFDLFRKLQGFEAAYGGVVRRIETGVFDRDEAREYLHRIRRIPDGPPLEAMVTRAKGGAFFLSMLADEWQEQDGLTVEEIRDIPGPELYYLAQRVLKRIPELSVRWLLRYGVVPRRLTRDFILRVMLKELRRAMAGERMLDDPEKGSQDIAPLFVSVNVGETGDEALATALWNHLLRYASTVSFIHHDAGDTDALAFHDEVLHPMRRELQQQRVFARLHRAALEEARRLAAASYLVDSDRWEAHSCDAVYHAFQFGERLGRSVWRRAIADARSARAWKAAYGLAVELQTIDYVGPDGRPHKRRNGKPLLSPSIQVDAAVTRTDVAVSLALETPENSEAAKWMEASGSLDKLEATLRRNRRVRVNRGLLAAMRARVVAQSGEAARARLILAAGRSSVRTTEERYELAVAMAEAYRGDPRSLEHFERALKLAARLRDVSPRDRAWLRERTAMECAHQDRLELAEDHYVRLRRESSSLPFSERLMTLAELANVRVRIGNFKGAVEAAAAARELSGRTPERPVVSGSEDAGVLLAAHARVEERASAAYRLAGDLSRAEEAATRASELARTASSPDGSESRLMSVLAARASVQTAHLLIAQRRWRAAIDELKVLRRSWSKLNYTDGVARALVLTVRFLRTQVGDVRLATQLLREGLSLSVPANADGFWLLRGERLVTAVTREPLTARREASKLVLAMKLARRPRHRVQASLALLHVRSTESGVQRQLVAAVREMTPRSSARRFVAAALDPERRLVVRDAVRKILLRELSSSWPAGGDAQRAARRLPWRDRLDRACIALALDELSDASRWAESVRSEASRRGDIQALCEAAPLVWQLEGVRGRSCTAPELRKSGELKRETPGAVGVAALAEACVAVRAGRSYEARALADLAISNLDDVTDLPTVWLARALIVRARLLPSGSAGYRDDLVRATALFGRLGRNDELRRLTNFPIRLLQLPATPAAGRDAGKPLASSSMTLRWQVDGKGRVVSKFVAGPREATASRRTDLGELGSVLASHSRDTADRALPTHALADHFARNWPGAMRELGSMFPVEFHEGRWRGSRRRLRVVAGGVLAALPIECARVGRTDRDMASLGSSVPTLFRTFDEDAASGAEAVSADAVESDSAERAARPDGVTRADRPPSQRVLIVVQSERATKARSGHVAHGRRLAGSYEEAGFKVDVVESAQVEQLHVVVAKSAPALVHLRAPLHESTSGGGIAIDFQGMPVTASALADLLSHSDVRRGPIVVVDVPLALGGREEVRQLLLRNAFASELFALRTVVAVVGLGFGASGADDLVAATFAKGLARDSSLASVVMAVRRQYLRARGPSYVGLSRLGRDAMFAGTALWSYRPDVIHMPTASGTHSVRG